MGLVCKVDTYSSAEVGTSIGGSPVMWSLIQTQLTAFIAAVNANASNTSRQLTLTVAPTAVNTDAYRGFVLQINHPVLPALYAHLRMNNSTVTHALTVGTIYTAGSANGNAGTVTSTFTNANITAYASQSAADVVVAYDDTNGQEFFVCNQRIGSNTAMVAFLLAKDTMGDWCVIRQEDSGGGTTQTGRVCVSPYTSSAYALYDLSASSNTSSTFPMSTGIDFSSSSTGIPDGDPVTNKSWIRVANSKIIYSYYAEPLVPLMARNNEDWVTVGSGFAVNMTSIIS